MKIKWDFVTNSSSCCFLLLSADKITETEFIDSGIRPSVINDFQCMSTIEELIAYTESAKECDWVMKVRGPIRFWGMKKEWYEKGKEILQYGDHVVCIDIERSTEALDHFEELVAGLDCEIIDEYFD